ncbi:MAG: pyruvate formate lyase-activating protein [Alistipes sp.]|nr:pyruvate formate lyase-activating protein [Alistipes sp.]
MLRIHSFESLGTYDGPGVRLVVFMQGCNFRCLYCANPDTIDPCGEHREVSEEEIYTMACDQRPFFGKRGGITFSGGEPTMQAKALVPLFRKLKEAGIHICLDTNGSIHNEAVEELWGLTDLVLLDMKEFNPAQHRLLTGHDNSTTLRTAEWLEAHQHPFWLRYVWVPGYSDIEADVKALGEHFGKFQMVERVEILPYHRLGVHKWEAMGWQYRLEEVKEPSAEALERAKALFEAYFPTVFVN